MQMTAEITFFLVLTKKLILITYNPTQRLLLRVELLQYILFGIKFVDVTKQNTQKPPPLPLLTKIFHGFGAAAFGAKNNGFDYFLLFFYAQVVGLDPALAGLAIALALVFDAFSDPIVGFISDNLRTRWGRRHPLMYAAAFPASLFYLLLWMPPDLSQIQLFIYVTVLAIFIRTLITLFEVPSSALTAELTLDYDERTQLQSFRMFFGWTMGNVISVIAFAFIFAASISASGETVDGRLDQGAYFIYGLLGASVIFVAMLGSARGTHSRIPYLQKPPPKRTLTISRIFGEVAETLLERSFMAIFFASLISATATGVVASLTWVRLSYFWEFSSNQIFLWTLWVFVAVTVGAAMAPFISRRMGKKKAVIVLGILAFSVSPLPILLRLLDTIFVFGEPIFCVFEACVEKSFNFMPPNGDPLLFPLLAAIEMTDLALIVALSSIFYAMIADLVEQNQVKTGRRSEGLFYAAVTFTRKSSQGIGVFIGSLILGLASIPARATPSEVTPESLFTLGAWYVPTLYALYTSMLLFVFFYKIDRDSHEKNLRIIAEREAASSTSSN